jgi:putative ABC transport system ATP-binding protein
MDAALIDICDACKAYHLDEVEIPAVRGVTLRLPAGQFMAITGASGSGKSTFMHLVGCLDRLDAGTYAFEGQAVEQLSRGQLATLRNRRIGFVFQSFNLLARTSIVDNVALPLTYQGVRRRERHRRAAEMIERVGLSDRSRHHPNQLSGGQQQRVAIARALVTRPAVVLADEPTGNLDTTTSLEIMTLLTTMNREQGVSIVLVTHEPEIAAHAQRQVVFRDGKIVRDTEEGAQARRHAGTEGAGRHLAVEAS